MAKPMINSEDFKLQESLGKIKHVIIVMSGKGGVGKSTISAGLSMALLRTQQPVLSVDLDPQNSLRLHLGAQEYQLDGCSFH